MRVFRHWKLILGLLALFSAGFATGVLASVKLIQHVVKRNTNLDFWVGDRMSEYQKRLKLTPEQKEKVRPLLEKAGHGFQGIVGDAFLQVIPLVQETQDQVRQQLTPEQQAEFDKMRDEMMKRWQDMASKEVQKAPPKGI
jgi:Spy/CpxP family protein refolding chaperone